MKIRKLVGAPIAAALACASIVLAAPMAHAASSVVAGDGNTCVSYQTIVYYTDANYDGATFTVGACSGSYVVMSSLTPYSGWNDAISSFKSSSGKMQYAYQDINYGGEVFNIGPNASVPNLATHPMLSTTWDNQISSFKSYMV